MTSARVISGQTNDEAFSTVTAAGVIAGEKACVKKSRARVLLIDCWFPVELALRRGKIAGIITSSNFPLLHSYIINGFIRALTQATVNIIARVTAGGVEGEGEAYPLMVWI